MSQKLMTSYEVLENHKLPRKSKQSLNSYIQDVIDDWTIITEINIKWRNNFLERLFGVIKLNV